MFDTDVLIWALRGSKKAAKKLDGASERKVSVVSYMELLQGARDKAEARDIKSFITDLSFTIVPLSENVGHRALVYIEEYALSSSMFVADAIIAATAVENHLTLCTGNRKHYKHINDLELKIFRP